MLELRQQLAAARNTLRHAKDHYDLTKAEAEQKAIAAGCNGKNAEERERNLLVELSKDSTYRDALTALRKAEAGVGRLEALLEGARDARRAEEWAIRARMTAVREQSIQGDADKSDVDGYFDDDAQEDLDAAIFEEQRMEDARYDRALVNELTGEVIGQSNGKRAIVYDEDLPF